MVLFVFQLTNQRSSRIFLARIYTITRTKFACIVDIPPKIQRKIQVQKLLNLHFFHIMHRYAWANFFETFLLIKVIAKCIGYISHCNSGRSYWIRIRICIIILSHAPPGNFAVLRSQLWQRVIRLRQHTDGCYILPELYQTIDLVRASIEVTRDSMRLKDDLKKSFANKLAVSSE